MIRHSAILGYFMVRVISALVLLKLSALYLPVRAFADLMQFLAFASLLNMAVVGGAQNGLIREAAAASEAELDNVLGAGLAILLAAIPLIGIPIALFSSGIAKILTGETSQWPAVVGIALLSIAAGPGQICWSIMSGRRRVAQSLGMQAAGILLGTAAAAWLIVRGSASGAAVAFAAGPVIATAATLPLVARLGLRWRPTTRGLRQLLGYSTAIAFTLGFSALVLFALRSVYRGQFGPVELGYWLVANRISDLSTQFIGLLMLQSFVPQIATLTDPSRRARMIVRYGVVGACLTGAALGLFLMAGRPLVHLFLSDAYLPAIPSIRLYMLGDLLRMFVSLAMFVAFAAAKPARYAAFEMSAMMIMAATALLLMRAGVTLAPQVGYLTGFGLVGASICAAFAVRVSRWPSAQSRPRDERRRLPPGSVSQLQ